jgi:hypothetical protein
VAFYRVWRETVYARQIIAEVLEELHAINVERSLVFM